MSKEWTKEDFSFFLPRLYSSVLEVSGNAASLQFYWLNLEIWHLYSLVYSFFLFFFTAAAVVIEVLLKNRCRRKGNMWKRHGHTLRAEHILKPCYWIDWVSFDSSIHDCADAFHFWRRPICNVSSLSLSPLPRPRLSTAELQHVLTFKRRNMLFELMRLQWNTRNRHTHNFFPRSLFISHWNGPFLSLALAIFN